MIGPSLESLLHHLTECPIIFLEKNPFLSTSSKRSIHSLAVIQDLFILQDIAIPHELKEKLHQLWSTEETGCWLGLQILSYLYSHPWFYQRPEFADGFSQGMEHIIELSKVMNPMDFISNRARREELCRLALYWSKLDPPGESQEQAGDRLKALDSLYRLRLEEKSRKARDRAREIRKKLQEAKVREAANTYGRE